MTQAVKPTTRTQQMFEAWQRGDKYSEIARQFGVTMGCAAMMVHRGRYGEAALAAERARSEKRRRLNGVLPRRPKLSDAERAAIIADADSGMKWRLVAAKHGVTKGTVAGIMWRRPKSLA